MTAWHFSSIPVWLWLFSIFVSWNLVLLIDFSLGALLISSHGKCSALLNVLIPNDWQSLLRSPCWESYFLVCSCFPSICDILLSDCWIFWVLFSAGFNKFRSINWNLQRCNLLSYVPVASCFLYKMSILCHKSFISTDHSDPLSSLQYILFTISTIRWKVRADYRMLRRWSQAALYSAWTPASAPWCPMKPGSRSKTFCNDTKIGHSAKPQTPSVLLLCPSSPSSYTWPQKGSNFVKIQF